jgi:Cu+-exporting ATPase
MSQIVTLKIDGMTCASCVARVEKTLLKINRVEAASVNLATEKAQIRLATDSNQGDLLPQLIQAIEKAGFFASLSQRIDQPKRVSRFDLYGGTAVLLSIFLSLPLVLPMALMLFDIHWMLPVWAQFLLASPVQFILGARFYVAGYKSLRSGSGNMDLLVAIGTSAAYGLSIYEWYQSGWGEPHQIYFEIYLGGFGAVGPGQPSNGSNDAARPNGDRTGSACHIDHGIRRHSGRNYANCRAGH